MEDTLREILRVDTRFYHSWVILALDRGIIETTDQLTSVMDTLSIISGLFVILCFQFLYSPPGGLLEDGRGEGAWMVILFNVSNILAVTFYFMCIMFGSLSGTAFRFSLRDVDKLRVLMLTNGASPSGQLFAAGYACASVAAGAAACGAVGIPTGVAIAVTAGAIGLMAYLFSVKLLHTGHVRYAWKEGRMGPGDPADFRLILSRTVRLCAIDRAYRAGRYEQALEVLRVMAAAEQ